MVFKNLAILIFPGLLFNITSLYSQENKNEPVTPVKHSILLVPFKPTMFMTEIGKAVNTSTHLNYSQITEAFRHNMDLALANTFKEKYSTVSILQKEKKTDTTLAYIYSLIGYHYDLMPGQDTAGESHAEFDPTLQKEHFINKGQLQVPMDYSKRFMNVDIPDTHLLPYLSKQYGTDIFIFINELDIKNVSNPTQDLNESNLRREVIVQYSILNTQYNYLLDGILTTYFPYSENDPKVIGEKYFPVIAQSMMKELTDKFEHPVPHKAIKNHTKTK